MPTSHRVSPPAHPRRAGAIRLVAQLGVACIALQVAACEAPTLPPFDPWASDVGSTSESPDVTPWGTLSGVITEVTPDGIRPSTGAYVNAWISNERRGYSYVWAHGPVLTDAEGRYWLSNLPPGDAVQLQIFKTGYLPQCAAPSVTAGGDLTLTGQLVAREALSPSRSSAPVPQPGYRLVSGTVYRETDGGREPVEGATVSYDLLGGDFPVAHTVTDTEGRYMLCGIPADRDVTIGGWKAGVGGPRLSGSATVPPGSGEGIDLVVIPG